MSKKLVRNSKKLEERIDALVVGHGLKLTQVAVITGMSYTGLHRAFVAKTLELSEPTVAHCHKQIDKWCATIAKV